MERQLVRLSSQSQNASEICSTISLPKQPSMSPTEQATPLNQRADLSPYQPLSTASSEGERDPLTLISFAAFVVRNLRFVALTAVACALVAFTTTLIIGPVFTAESRFTPQASAASTSRLAGLAAQFGISVPGVASQSPSDVYASLVQSREILDQVAVTPFPVSSDTSDVAPRSTLIELFRLKNRDRAQLHLDAVELLRTKIAASTDVRTGIVTLQTTTPWRSVSEAMNARILALIVDFDQTKRRSQARSEREFLEARSRESQQQLHEAEAHLAAFNDQNRVRASSQLAMEGARLQRAVDLAQQMFVTLSQNYEQARIEEVRNTPVVTIIDGPIGSAKRHRGLVKKTAIAFVLGSMLALAIAFIAEEVRSRRLAHPEEFERLMAGVHELLPSRRRSPAN